MLWMKPLLHLLVNIEPWLDAVVFIAILRAGLFKRFPAMAFYLGFRCFTNAGLYFILNEHHFISVSVRTQVFTYLYSYTACLLVGGIAIFFALQEVFKAVMSPTPGLQRLGLLVFRWASVIAVLAVLGMVPFPSYRGMNALGYASSAELQIMRCIAVLEIGLLVYLAFSVHSLGRSFRGRVFGIGLGFGLEASGQLISSVMLAKPQQSIWCAGNLVLESASIIALLTWTAYFLLPEPAEEAVPITLPVTSPLLRWNEIASALGQRPAHVALGTPSSAFFLQDVEQVVDKFLAKTP